MRTNIASLLMRLLVVGILSAGTLFLPVSPAASGHVLQSAALDAQPPVGLDASGSLPDAIGSDHVPIRDDDSILDALDVPDSDATVPSGFEDAPYVVAVALPRYARAALAGRTRLLGAPLRVEPRFLRYSRLLN